MKFITPKKISLLATSFLLLFGSITLSAQTTSQKSGSYTIKRPPTLAEKRAKEKEAKRAAKLGIPFGKTIALKTASGKYISSRNDKNQTLQPVADKLGDWEKFVIESQGGSVILIKALSNGNYLSVRTDENETPVRSNCTWTPAGWEKIIWKKVGKNKVMLKAEVNSKALTINEDGILKANQAGKSNDNNTFTYEILN